MDNTFKKDRRLRKSKEFNKVQSKGKKKHSKYFTLLYTPGRCRIGITVSTKVSNSPQRNYIKRCVREFFRTHKTLFNGVDVVLIAKPEMATIKYADICAALIKTIQKD